MVFIATSFDFNGKLQWIESVFLIFEPRVRCNI